jgi:hypothetical protein
LLLGFEGDACARTDIQPALPDHAPRLDLRRKQR